MTVNRCVVPGEWYAVLGDEVVVLLPPAAKARVAGVWERVDEGAGFDEVLDALISGGLRELPGFVLVSNAGGDVKLVIRGAGEARLSTGDGPVTITGDAGSTWVERHLTGVTAVRLRVADGDGTSYTLGSGLVRVSSVEQPVPESAGDTGPLVASQLLDPAPPEPVIAETMVAEPPIAEPVVAEQVGAAPMVSTHAVARLVFSHGEVVDVDRVVVVGRAPQPRGHEAGEPTLLVRVPSPHQEISSTHLEIRPGTGADHGAAVVTDLGSTNGTLVVQPGLPAEDLRPGIGVALVPGAVVDLGEGVTIQVTSV